MYVGSCNGYFRRLDATTGKVLWETNVRDAAAKQYFFHGDVFVAPDRIVASADVDAKSGAEAGVHAFDTTSGRQLWKYSAGRGVLGAVAGSASRVFAYTAAGDLIALNLASGKLEWTHALKAPVWESPVATGERVVAGFSDGSVIAFDSQTGQVQWERKLKAPVATSIRASGSDVYTGTADGTLYRLDLDTGEIRSSWGTDVVLRPVSAPVPVADAVLLLLSDNQANYRAVVSLNRALTRVRWRRNATDRWTTSRVFATARSGFVGAASGEVTAYCLSDGTPAWSYKLANAPIRSIGGTDERLFVGTPSGALYALRPPRVCM